MFPQRGRRRGMRIVDHVATLAVGAPGQRGDKYPKHYLSRHSGSLHRRLRDRDSGEAGPVPATGLFILIGAQPFTDWLPDAVDRDQWGFIVTGPDTGQHWPLQRAPFLFETTTPGVFAVGDVRHGSIKRVASAVGEGSLWRRDRASCGDRRPVNQAFPHFAEPRAELQRRRHAVERPADLAAPAVPAHGA